MFLGVKNQILKLLPTVANKQGLFKILTTKEAEVDMILSPERAGQLAFTIEDLKKLIAMSGAEMEELMKASPNCVNIGSQWYYLKETSLIELL